MEGSQRQVILHPFTYLCFCQWKVYAILKFTPWLLLFSSSDNLDKPKCRQVHSFLVVHLWFAR